jgi:hypothetical protein
MISPKKKLLGFMVFLLWSNVFVIYLQPRIEVAKIPKETYLSVSEGSNLLLNSTSNQTGALLDGWSQPEGWGVWSDSLSASLGLKLVSSDLKNDTLNLYCNFFLAGQPNGFKFRVYVNNALYAHFNISETTSQAPIRIKMDQIDTTQTKYFLINFKFESIKSPKMIGVSNDTRQLGVGLRIISLTKND